MDDWQKRRLASVEEPFKNSYDPTTDLDPDIARKINALAPQHRGPAVDQAFDDAGYYAKLKRFMGGMWNGDIYNKN